MKSGVLLVLPQLGGSSIACQGGIVDASKRSKLYRSISKVIVASNQYDSLSLYH